MDKNELIRLAKVYKRAATKEAEAKAEKEAARDAILAMFPADGGSMTVNISGMPVKVTVAIIHSERVDEKKVKENYPDWRDKALRVTDTPRVTVK